MIRGLILQHAEKPLQPFPISISVSAYCMREAITRRDSSVLVSLMSLFARVQAAVVKRP